MGKRLRITSLNPTKALALASTSWILVIEIVSRATRSPGICGCLPGPDREIVRARDREYTLRGSESRTLATVGAFRVVSSRDLWDHNDRPADPRSGDLRHLREQGLIETVRVPGYRDRAVMLTKEGRILLERDRDPYHERQQTFYAGLVRPRELEHDVQIYRAYEQAEAGLLERGARIDRVVLDHELKGEYQRWLHARNKDRDDCDGRPNRTLTRSASGPGPSPRSCSLILTPIATAGNRR